jgi:hypothetical protein
VLIHFLFIVRSRLRITFEKKSYFFVVPMDLDVRMKAVALGALFLIVRFDFFLI